MSTIEEIRRSIDERRAELLAEYEQLGDVEALLAGNDTAPAPLVLAPDPAPYGYKKDGTPRKRPAPDPEQARRAGLARWKKAREAA